MACKTEWAVCTILVSLCDLQWKREIIAHGNYFLSQSSWFFLLFILHHSQAAIEAVTDLKRQEGQALRFKWKSSWKPICANYISYDLTLGTTTLQAKNKKKTTHWKFFGFYIWKLNLLSSKWSASGQNTCEDKREKLTGGELWVYRLILKLLEHSS